MPDPSPLGAGLLASIRRFSAALRPTLPLLLLGGLGACAPLLQRQPARAPAPLDAALDSIFADPAFAHAHWGIRVRSLEDGQEIYSHNAHKSFVPASNMKLLTGAAVLETLGPEYRYRTDFLTSGSVHDGVLRGALVVRGSGDPTFSTRFSEEARQVFRGWADSLRVHGVRRIAGPIIGVDSAFSGPSLGSGWAWDDLEFSYAAEFGALQFNEGAIDLRVFPSREVGRPAVVTLSPPTQYVSLNNQTVTTAAGAPTRIEVTRDPIGPGLTVSGQIAADAELQESTIAVRDPTLYFLSVLRETLREAGIVVEGPPLDADALPAEDLSVRRTSPLFTYASPPLREILPAMMKPSQNGIAETLLHTLGWELRGEGSARAGLAVADSLFRNWGLDTRTLRLADGSGLSRYNLVSPDFVMGLLLHMTQSPNWELWYASLPTAGVDGTMQQRLRGTELTGRVHAKTGTLSGVRALSGYLTTPGGERLVFSTLVNHHRLSSAAVDSLVDAALLRIARERR